MRPIERIDNFLDKVNWGYLLEDRWKLPAGTCGEDSIVVNILSYSNYSNMETYWKKNPDQRIGQVLINLGLVGDSLQIWNDEESDILLAQGLEPREVIFWTSYYDKDMNHLTEPKSKLIKDLDTDHLDAIAQMFLDKNETMPNVISDELKLRYGKTLE